MQALGMQGRCSGLAQAQRRPAGRRTSVQVQAKMKIKTKIAQNQQRVQYANVDLDKLYTDASYSPEGPQHGPVKVVSIPGEQHAPPRASVCGPRV